MNALANSQEEELRKFINRGYPDERWPVRFECYTGQESDDKRNQSSRIPLEILEAFDLTQSYRDAAELAGCDHHTVTHWIDRRDR